MLNMLCFIILVTLTASYIQIHDAPGMIKTRNIIKTEKLCMFAVCLSFILFAGLRTWYNDTANYKREYWILISPNIHFNFLKLFKEKYYLFDVYGRLIKKIFKGNIQWLFMISSVITNTAFLRFYRKYSPYFAFTVLCFIIIGPFLLTCAALKQVIAMSIMLYGTRRLLEGDKKIFYLMLLPAYAFHPYILVLVIAPFLMTDRIWDKRMVTIIVIALIGATFFAVFAEKIINLIGSINDKITTEDLLDHTINPLRVAVDLAPVILSFILRNKINAKHDRIMIFGINMMIVSAIFTFLSLFGNPIYIYRMGNYFCFMNAIVMPWMLTECLPNDKMKKLVVMLFFALYFVVFAVDLFYGNFRGNPFVHTSIKALFK